jgi:tetratricopeptide (TPR) repeat protein
VVGIISIDPKNIQTFSRWNRVHQYFYRLNLQAENMYNDPKLYQSALEHFSDGYPLVKGDPFLESCFGEWVTQFHWGPDHQSNIILMKHAIDEGYPCAHLYYKLGEFLFLDHRLPEAKKAFERAVSCRPNQTQAADWIQTIDQIMSQNKGKAGGLDTHS